MPVLLADTNSIGVPVSLYNTQGSGNRFSLKKKKVLNEINTNTVTSFCLQLLCPTPKSPEL